MRVAVLLFPGSNCDHDVLHAFGTVLGADAYLVWHKDGDLKSPDLVVVPGGFSFGDYLRCGAMAKVAPVMGAVKTFAEQGGAVLGICNGFQILCEAGLLPGVLLQNMSRRFLSRPVDVRLESSRTPFFKGLNPGTVYRLPTAHFDGNYFAAEGEPERLAEAGQVVLRYCGPAGDVAPDSPEFNPNGSSLAIAGVCNERGNVVGFMPHPERVAEEVTTPFLYSRAGDRTPDGLPLLDGVLKSLSR